MAASAAASVVPARRPPIGVVLGIAAAWAVSLAVVAAGKGDLAHHDRLIGGDLPVGLAVLLFLVGWQVMVAAMMLPSTLPLLRMFRAASAKQEQPGLVLGFFVAGYATVWGIAGSVALAGDLALHLLVDRAPALDERPGTIAGAVFVLAGAFQFSTLKDRCLDQCRHPAMWMLRNYRRGTASAFHLGGAHGRFCLGCCWALMLLMFAVGVANLVWMAALAALMAYEKIGRHGVAAGRVAGVVLIAWGALLLGGLGLPPG